MPANHSLAKAGLGSSIVQALAKQLGAKVELMEVNPGTAVLIVYTHVAVFDGHPVEAPARLAV
jgi:two-component sensor histidine kinase